MYKEVPQPEAKSSVPGGGCQPFMTCGMEDTHAEANGPAVSCRRGAECAPGHSWRERTSSPRGSPPSYPRGIPTHMQASKQAGTSFGHCAFGFNGSLINPATDKSATCGRGRNKKQLSRQAGGGRQPLPPGGGSRGHSASHHVPGRDTGHEDQTGCEGQLDGGLLQHRQGQPVGAAGALGAS